MAENLGKRPSKGILKSSSSFEKPDAPSNKKHKETKWDEMNIIATLHPADKDYGHMKVDEPKTPYNWVEGEADETDGLDAALLAEKIRLGASQPCKGFKEDSSESVESDESEEDETPEEKAKRNVFESKRKAHYNEYYAVKLARKLMDTDVDGEDEDEDMEKKEDEETADNCGCLNCPDSCLTQDGAVSSTSREASTSKSPSKKDL